MANLSYFSHAVLLKWMRGVTTPVPTQLYVGMLQTQPNPDGSNVQEPAGSYARMPVTFTTQTTLNGVTSMQNASDIVFPTASQDWPQVSWVGIFSQDGTLLVYGQAAQPRLIKASDSLGIAAGTLQIKLK